MSQKQIRKILVANRGEIAIRIFRACTELGIRTVAVYSKEDSGSYHRYKADEAYLVGEGKKPIDAYLDIEGIIGIAKKNGIDAIHPGYGFLSENIHFAKRCAEENIVFIGPKEEHLIMFGDKVKAREVAVSAGLPVIPGSDGPVGSLEEVKAFAQAHGYPVIIKASLGGGGRGMRIVRSEIHSPRAMNVRNLKQKQHLGRIRYMLKGLLKSQNISRFKYWRIHQAILFTSLKGTVPYREDIKRWLKLRRV